MNIHEYYYLKLSPIYIWIWMYCEMMHHASVSTSFSLSSGTISQYLLVRFGAFLVYIISIMDSRYPISFVEKLSTLEFGQNICFFESPVKHGRHIGIMTPSSSGRHTLEFRSITFEGMHQF